MEQPKSWDELKQYLAAHEGKVYYQAPMDRTPTPVAITRHFKNGKLRVSYRNGTFTADPSHLDRFRLGYWHSR